MGTKFSTQSISGYNATPPADDGSATEANRITWAKIKSKLNDPIKTLTEAINTALVTHFDESVADIAVNTTTTAAHHKRILNVTGAYTVSLGDAATMAAGYIVTVKNSHTAAITVDLDTSGDTLDGTANGSVSLAPKESFVFATNEATADGYVIISTRPMSLDTPQATTSGTAIDFTSVPSWAKKITVMLDGVSTDGTNAIKVQLGDSGGFETAGYSGVELTSGGSTASLSTGFTVNPSGSPTTDVVIGQLDLLLMDESANTWSGKGMFTDKTALTFLYTVGTKSLSAPLSQIRVTNDGIGTDDFDAGTINIIYG